MVVSIEDSRKISTPLAVFKFLDASDSCPIQGVALQVKISDQLETSVLKSFYIIERI